MVYTRAINEMCDGVKPRIMIVGGDSEHFLVVLRLQYGSTRNPLLFALVMDELTSHIQDELSWCMVFAYDIVSTQGRVNVRLEV